MRKVRMSGRWSWWWRLLLWPRRVAGEAGRWSLGRAWAVHALGLAIGASWSVGVMLIETGGAALRRYETLVAAAIVLVLVELALVAGAAWNAAWGAGDETPRRSLLGALKRMMALSPHLALVGCVTGLAMVWAVERLVNPVGVPLLGVAILGLHYYAVWMLLSVLSAGRSGARARWPGRCEGCNYALVELGLDDHCPECGRAVRDSLGAEVRPGLWRGAGRRAAREAGLGVGRRLGRGAFASLRCFFRPRACGATVRLFDPSQRTGRCVAGSIALFILAVAGSLLALILTVSLSQGTHWDAGDALWVMVLCVTWGGGLGIVVLGVILGTASLSGWAAGRPLGRNLMPASVQIAAAMSGAFAWWALLYAAGVGAMMLASERGLDLMETMRLLGIDPRYGVTLLVLGPHGLFVILWTAQLARATRAARYSNV